MVTYNQLADSVHAGHCFSLTAKHRLFSDALNQWLCEEELEQFWQDGCVGIADYLHVCEEEGIALFLGKCVV